MQSSDRSRSWRAIDVPQVAALRPPIKLDRARASTHFRPPEAEHARSYGTAASAAGKSCCAPFVEWWRAFQYSRGGSRFFAYGVDVILDVFL